MEAIEGQISVLEARDWIKECRKAYLLDLRDKASFDEYQVKPFQNVPAVKISKIIPQIDTENTVLLICQDGIESIKAQKMFSSCGIQSYIVRGGINYWKKIFRRIKATVFL